MTFALGVNGEEAQGEWMIQASLEVVEDITSLIHEFVAGESPRLCVAIDCKHGAIRGILDSLQDAAGRVQDPSDITPPVFQEETP